MPEHGQGCRSAEDRLRGAAGVVLLLRHSVSGSAGRRPARCTTCNRTLTRFGSSGGGSRSSAP
eukprot:2512980-Rhodomonas_salina.1